MSIITVTQSNFKESVLQSCLPVLVDFWAPWCGPCVQMSPVLDQLAEEYEGRVVVAKINVDEERALSAMFQVMSIPMLAIFHQGKKVSDMVGAQPIAVLRKKLDALESYPLE